MHDKKLVTCEICGMQFWTKSTYRDWCSPKCKLVKDERYKRQIWASKPQRKWHGDYKEEAYLTTKERRKAKHDAKFSDTNFYWILKYMRKLGQFFLSDIVKVIAKDGIYFSAAQTRVAVEYWIERGYVAVSPIIYHSDTGHHPVKKYILNVDFTDKNTKNEEGADVN